jgi:hypothetical protein
MATGLVTLTLLAAVSSVAFSYGIARAVQSDVHAHILRTGAVDKSHPTRPNGRTPAAAVKYHPSVVHFGTVTAGTTSAPASITLTNGGPASITVSTAAATPPFNVTANTCTTIEPNGGTCSIAVEFAPVLHGKFKGTLEVVYETARARQHVKLSGIAK